MEKTKNQLAIKGHPTRGKEVIEILEMLGANNKENYIGNDPDALYIINDSDNNIDLGYGYDNRAVFKLEEFLEKYPYKVGDKVINDNYSGYGIITTMVWDSDDWCVKYRVEFEDFGVIEWFKFNEIKISEVRGYICDNDPLHELCESKSSALIIDSEVCGDEVEIILNDYEIVIKDGKTYAIKKKPKYPTTYEECCDVLKIPKEERYIDIDVPLSYNDLLYKFTELLICRDAYWKIAEEEMGLDKPWNPYWDDNYQKKWLITFYQDEINFTNGTNVQFILAFPTEEMRDEFFKNFKELIEKCKKLL